MKLSPAASSHMLSIMQITGFNEAKNAIFPQTRFNPRSFSDCPNFLDDNLATKRVIHRRNMKFHWISISRCHFRVFSRFSNTEKSRTDLLINRWHFLRSSPHRGILFLLLDEECELGKCFASGCITFSLCVYFF